jgi:hypothetical protein
MDDDDHPTLDAALLRRVFDELPGKPASRAWWWAVLSAVAFHGPVTPEAVADLLSVRVDHAARAVEYLAAQGLVETDAGGAAYYRAGVQVHDSSTTTSTSMSLVRTPSSSVEEACTRTALAWVPPAVVRGSGFLDAACELCVHFAGQVEERGDRRARDRALSRAWVLPMEAILRLDGREPRQVRVVMDWLHAGRDEPSSFWRNNVLAPSTLRSRWDRMAVQYKAARRGKPSRSSAVLQPPGAPRLADELGSGRG